MDSQARVAAHLRTRGHFGEVVGVFCDGAAAAAAAGDHGGLVKALVDGMATAGGEFDALCIAQYSLSPAHDELARITGVPVFSPPRFAAAAIRDPAHPVTPTIGCIADDYTGGTDVAAALRRHGLRTVLLFGLPDDRCASSRTATQWWWR